MFSEGGGGLLGEFPLPPDVIGNKEEEQYGKQKKPDFFLYICYSYILAGLLVVICKKL